MKYVLAIYAIGGGIGSIFLDWRAALLMLSVWWADNLATILSDRDSRLKREAPGREAGPARKGESGGGEANRPNHTGEPT